ncbi:MULTISPECIES: GNAT family N-acetyltransferase [Spirosoma]|uniref:GNAT family N-acetyltransferase n=1 Tax=Spirosoma liriopis TaxID=2937440 RepID=A0ABT0HTK2_9BACT|nr:MULTISPECIES: GNAT family N-acetyltransferase [Spirosoma]MCK8495527.1 GNAT family N-acetyltransferase [Spirosoma liriopis]UHG94546.1 GNAT family N-acetyltransferase [Spirosoma oryzicola]
MLYRNADLTLLVSAHADEQAIALLQQTTYGTEGIRYQQTGQEAKLNRLNNPFFFHLYQHQTLIGLYCLDQRAVGFPDASISGYYGRYLAVHQNVQGRGYGQLLKTTAVNYVNQHVSTPHLFYSYIESRNTRSMAASIKENFTSIARLKTFMFRRFSPHKDTRFIQASLTDSSRNLQLVQRQYTDYGFQNFLNINYKNNYFALEEDGHLLVGVQANLIIWKLVHIPGKFGSFIHYVAPFLPGLRRFFNPARQSFVALEGVYIAEGQTQLLPVLLESVLAHFDVYTAMWQIDEKDPLINLLNSPKMGRFSQFQPGVTTHLMVKDLDRPSHIQLGKEPAYVSCFDYS